VQLWVAWDDDARRVDAAIVTEIINYPRLSECRIWLVGGRRMKTWVDAAHAEIEAFARQHGCAFLTGGMRRGWLRIGGAAWRETGISIEKDLR
jgi:hypothetical protein